MEKLTKEKFIIFDDVFDRLRLEYEHYEYCILDNVRIYQYYGEYRLVGEDVFEKKRNVMPVVAKIYYCNDIQSVKAKMSLEAFYGITRYELHRKEVMLIRYKTLEELQKGAYETLGKVNGILYLPNKEESELITKNKHRRVKANGLRRIFENDIKK